MFKKWLCAILCVVMLASAVLSASAAPEDTTAFTLSVTEGTVGDTVTVSLSISENSRFANAMLYLHYDPDAVSYVEDSLEAGSASPKSGTMFDAKDHKDESFVKCAYITGGVVTKGGVLLSFDFEVLSDAPAVFSLSFDECQGEAEDGTIFDVRYEITGCVLNNNGSAQVPTGGPVVTTTTVTTTAVSETTVGDTGSTTTVGTTKSTMPTMVVTDEGNNKITIPVVTTTDANGNSATVPVVVVTDAQGATVTVPVVVVTDTAGSVATIPVADGTDAQGNSVTIPVAIVTDAQGNVETVPVATATDAYGSIVTIPVTTSATTSVSAAENSGLTTGIVIVVICVIVAVVVAIAAMKLRKKNEE